MALSSIHVVTNVIVSFRFKSRDQSTGFSTFFMHSAIHEKVVPMYPEIELLDYIVILFCFLM